MQFKIPQNVQIEDKIVGPLTFKDLIIAGVGGGIGYVAYLELDNETWPFIAIPAGLLTIAIIFVKINGLKFSQWLYSLVLYIVSPQKRIWRNMSNDVALFDSMVNPKKKEEKKDDSEKELIQKKQEMMSKIGEISKQVDTF